MGKKTGNKYYVVWKGHNPGVYTSWNECKKQVQGVVGAQYKAFANKQEAEDAAKSFYENYIGIDTKKGASLSDLELEAIGKPIIPSLSVDAACAGNPGILEYRGVITATKKQVFARGPYPEGTVNIGEFLAIVLGLAYLKQNKLKIPIYSDSNTAISWVSKRRVNTKLRRTAKNKVLFDAIEKAIEWLKTNEWNNPILKWRTDAWGEIPADYGRK
ncbi:MAG TPA: ribonuclease H [Bacteroidales bacterium]|nr:ribonuclease H [Bacteroidales bacterium]